MALTIEKEPTNPCFSKNIVAYQVDTDSDLAVKCRVWVEDTPHSDTWTFLTEIKAIPNSNGECFFYLADLLEEDVLQYDKPDVVDTLAICLNSSRRIKCNFFEYDPSALELVEEFYHKLSDKITNSELPISTALESGEDYVLVLDTEIDSGDLSNLPSIELDSAGVNQQFTLLYDLGDQLWYDITNISHAHDEINLPGFTKATLYKGVKPTITASDIRAVLLGGYFETDLENATFERTPDGIIVTTPDGIGVNWLF